MVSDTDFFALVEGSLTLSHGSKVAYIKQLKSLQKALDGEALAYIIVRPSVVEHLDAPLATRVAYTNAINSLFKREAELEVKTLNFVSPSVRAEWADLLKRLHQDRSEIVDKNIRSKKEEKNWVSAKEWKEMDENLSTSERGSQAQLLVAFHTQIPPPRGGDLAQVRICADEKECPDGNIVIVSGSDPRLVIRDHKTRRKYGAIIVKLPSSLEQDVHVSLDQQPRDYLFVNSHNEMYPTRDAFMTWKSNTFQRLFGRDVTTNIARRVFATSEDMNAPLHKLKESAKAMGHSVETHHAYRVAPQGDELSEEPPAQRQRLEGGGLFSSIGKILGITQPEKRTTTTIQHTINPKDLQHMCEQAYALFNNKYPENVGKWDLIQQTVEDLLYRYDQTFVVAVRGTQGSPTGLDWTANRTIPMNGLADTARCKKDLITVRGWKEQYPYGDWFATGHSLGGAICDELLRAGLVREAYTFNPAVQTMDFNGQLLNHRIYARGDPLYQLFGRHTVGAILQPAGSLAKELLTRISPTYFATNALSQHNLSAFDAHPLQGGMAVKAMAAFSGVNPYGYDNCSRDSARVLAQYYSKLKRPLETQEFRKLMTAADFSEVLKKYLGEENVLDLRFHEMEETIKPYNRKPYKAMIRNYDYLLDELHKAQTHHRGGLLHVFFPLEDGTSITHMVAYVYDPTTRRLSIFDPVGGETCIGVKSNIPQDFHIDAYSLDTSLKPIIDFLSWDEGEEIENEAGEMTRVSKTEPPFIKRVLAIQIPIDKEAEEWRPTPETTKSEGDLKLINEHIKKIEEKPKIEPYVMGEVKLPSLLHEDEPAAKKQKMEGGGQLCGCARCS